MIESSSIAVTIPPTVGTTTTIRSSVKVPSSSSASSRRISSPTARSPRAIASPPFMISTSEPTVIVRVQPLAVSSERFVPLIAVIVPASAMGRVKVAENAPPLAPVEALVAKPRTGSASPKM